MNPSGPAEQAYVAAFWNSVATGVGLGLVPLVYSGVVRRDFDKAHRISTYLSLLWASYTAAMAGAFQSLLFNQPELLSQLAAEMDEAVVMIDEALKNNDPELQRLLNLYESGLFPAVVQTPGFPQRGMFTSQPALPEKPAQEE
ncbi:hypothetical protein JW872_01120 [Candidatus Babeliales bacterium]|nr:hypothetical protein [Candidatus Babeliales bacterium]